ncbi:VIT1/CCC1 transporter family protein [Patescibacteria group bacterium]
MKQKDKKNHLIVETIREIVFGLEDGLVSTLGAVTGIAAGAGNTFIVILSGLVLIAVEASSMAAGSYLSSKSAVAAEIVFKKAHKKSTVGIRVRPIRAAAVMGIFYFFGGFVPLSPYFFLPIKASYAPSIILTAVVLFLLGVWSAKYTKRSRVRSGIEMATISLAAALIGFVIGRVVSLYFGAELPM